MDVQLTREDVDGANLLTYAWARDAIYGPTQEAVTRVRPIAKRNPARLAEVAYRPPQLWVAEVDEANATAGLQALTSRFKGCEVTRTLHVTHEGVDEPRRRAWSPRARSDAA
jgi:hypothetical protein